MKRIGNLYNAVISIENLQLADSIARKGKASQYGVINHDKNREANLSKLHQDLFHGTYRTSEYTTFVIREPKERIVYRLPYFPDRITHHAIMNVLEPIFTAMFSADSYSCIKGKGIHGAQRAVEKSLQDIAGTRYCLKMDIRKFYPSINHDVLKALLRRKIRDKELLRLLDEIIDSAAGVPIGNYLSQYLANFYLCGFDHWIKQTKRVKHYFRYADDLVILGPSKPELHQLRVDIADYLQQELRLQLKPNYQVFPVDARGIDFVGYVFRHSHTRLRKSIKKNYCRMMKRRYDKKSEASYNGWLSHCKARHLIKITNEHFRRNANRSSVKGDDGRENINKENTESANRGTRIQHCSIKAEQGRRLPDFADQTQRR